MAAAETYVVRPGDTLYDIGMQYRVEPDELATANNIADPSRLQVGQRLTIPSASYTPATATARSTSTYTVARGDTLSEIAERFGVSASALASANGIVDPRTLQLGQQIRIPGGSAAPAPASSHPSTYRVVGGDTLSGIADMFGLTARTVAAANNIANPDSLRVGQELIIPQRADLSARGGPRLSFVWPAFGKITGVFHERGPWWTKGYHEGLDIGAPHGSVVRAVEQGLVIEAETGWNSGYGTYIKIDHGNGLHTLYGHLSRLDVSVWQEVKRGQTIGRVGSTGASTGPHLHLEVRVDGVKKDPLLYLP